MIHAADLSPRRRRKREARAARILEAAMAILVDEGLEALSIHRVAQKLDYTVGALYRYFPSKDALMAELERRVVERFGRLLEGAEARAEEVITERGLDASTASILRLLVVSRAYRAFPERMPEQFSLISRNLAEQRFLLSDEEDARVIAALMPLLKGVVLYFGQATRAKALVAGNDNERAMVFWSGIHGSLQLRKLRRLEPGFVDPDALSVQITRTLLDGWQVDRAALQRAEALLDELEQSGVLLPVGIEDEDD